MITHLFVLLAACGPALDQPRPIVYDHAACDHCAMLISDPRFAAQLVTRDGERLDFDDPACLFRHVVEERPAMAHAWFRDSTVEGEDVWLPWSGVEFVPAKGAPMNGGVAAVPVGTPDAFGFGEASSRVIGAAGTVGSSGGAR